MQESKKFSITTIPGYYVYRPFVVDQIMVADNIMMIAAVDGAAPIEARVPKHEGEDKCLAKLKAEIVKAIATTHKEAMPAHIRNPEEEKEFVAEARHQAELAKAR